MLDENVRTAILLLQEQGHGSRAIASALNLSRGAVRDVIKSGSANVPPPTRPESAEPLRERIMDLFTQCRGNLVRVHEELTKESAAISYQTLTRFCRRHSIGYTPPLPSGRYTFVAAEEMQHDTSPHDVVIGGKKRRVQTASLVLCFSRMIFMQLYPAFTRFHCKVFLTDALKFFAGSCGRCMIDNTHVVVSSGTGRNMVPSPEMEAFGKRFGFSFAAHEVGNANRSARVERAFDHIENNFIPGRTFKDFQDLNVQAQAWCEKVNGTPKRDLHARPIELFATERTALRALPLHVPDVYQLHHRIVDVEGYVSVHTNRYSVPWQLIARQLEVRETKDLIEVFDGPRKLCTHGKLIDAADTHVTLAEHRPPRGQRVLKGPGPDEQALARADSVVQEYFAAFKKRHPGKAVAAARRLRRMVRDYPAAAVHQAVADALQFGLFDLPRLERLVLRKVGHAFFNFTTDDDNEEDS